jgi:hypothetical protein
MGFSLQQKPFSFQLWQQGLAALKAVKPFVGPRFLIQAGVGIEYVYQGQVMPL